MKIQKSVLVAENNFLEEQQGERNEKLKINITAKVDELETDKLSRFWPKYFGEKAWTWCKENLSGGKIKNGDFVFKFAYNKKDKTLSFDSLSGKADVENGNLSITFEAPEQGTPEGYNVYNNGTLIAEKTAELSHSITANEVNVISVVAVYADDKTSVPVVKIDGTIIGVEETAQADNTFSIYPNPARGYVRVSGEDINTISVYNCLGALVERVEAKGNTTSISTSSYNTGVYFITVEQNNGVSTTQKMVVTH